MKQRLALLALALALYAFITRPLDPFQNAPKGVIAQEPVQSQTDKQPFSFHDYGLRPHGYVLTPLATYEIKGRALSVRRYYASKYKGNLVPFDLAIGWGTMSDPALLSAHFLFEHRADPFGGRFLWTKLRTDDQNRITPAPTGMDDPMTHLSNNHLIPADQKIFRQLRGIQAGDLVQIKGYLVSIRDPGNPDWVWASSTTRSDTSDHWGGNNTSCETIFVTDVARILSPRPLVIEPAPEAYWPP